MPLFLRGDLNSAPGAIPPVATKLEQQRLYDVGAHSKLWGAEAAPEPTAFAHGAKQASRIDFILTNEAASRQLRSFSLGPFGVFDVHRALTCQVE
eukprot:15478326-Alexandrium_andersonii.AAC.1